MSEQQLQVADQCKVIIALAQILIEVHKDIEHFARGTSSPPEDMMDGFGKSTAQRMEALGDMINGMDAVEEEDGWMRPIFEKAHAMWPNERQPV